MSWGILLPERQICPWQTALIRTVTSGMDLANYLFNLGKHDLAALASFAQIINTHSRHEGKPIAQLHWTQLSIYAITQARLHKSYNLKTYNVSLSAKDCSWLWSHTCPTEPFLNAYDSHSCFFQYYWFKREVPLVLNSVQDYTALEKWPFYSSLQVTWSACKTCWALLSGLLSGREIIAAERKRCRLGNYFKRFFFSLF